MLHLKGLVGQVDRGIRNGASARLDVHMWKRSGMESDSRIAGNEDVEVADKGRRSFLRGDGNKTSITQKVLAVNVYLVGNSNGCGRC